MDSVFYSTSKVSVHVSKSGDLHDELALQPPSFQSLTSSLKWSGSQHWIGCCKCCTVDFFFFFWPKSWWLAHSCLLNKVRCILLCLTVAISGPGTLLKQFLKDKEENAISYWWPRAVWWITLFRSLHEVFMKVIAEAQLIKRQHVLYDSVLVLELWPVCTVSCLYKSCFVHCNIFSTSVDAQCPFTADWSRSSGWLFQVQLCAADIWKTVWSVVTAGCHRPDLCCLCEGFWTTRILWDAVNLFWFWTSLEGIGLNASILPIENLNIYILLNVANVIYI